ASTGGQVQLHGLLVGVQVGKQGTAFDAAVVTDNWSHRSRGASGADSFHLDYLGTKVRKQLAAVLSGHPFGQFDDPHTSQRSHAHSQRLSADADIVGAHALTRAQGGASVRLPGPS